SNKNPTFHLTSTPSSSSFLKPLIFFPSINHFPSSSFTSINPQTPSQTPPTPPFFFQIPNIPSPTTSLHPKSIIPPSPPPNNIPS
ncbi:hypothetical protein, partial [Bacillus pumilus]|uniref:hypothetical protein n=1 Tax=Bacillus pumilus TaxID=1408 RepID=UPI001C92ED86